MAATSPESTPAVGPDGRPSDRAALRKGDTHWSQQTGGAQPRQPNERDESSDSQAAARPKSTPMEQQAYADAANSAVDTDRAPVTDHLYNDKVRDSEPKGGPRK